MEILGKTRCSGELLASHIWELHRGVLVTGLASCEYNPHTDTLASWYFISAKRFERCITVHATSFLPLHVDPTRSESVL